MCVYLPSWPLQRIGHAEPALRNEAVALVDASASRGAKVVLGSKRAARAGIRPNMPLAEALALVPRLVMRAHDPEADLLALLKLTRSAERYSPLVGLEEGPAPQSLVLDVTGCAPCFGGEDRLLQRATRELTEEGWIVRIASANTLGAAWALAHYAPLTSCAALGAHERASHEVSGYLHPLPIAALRLPTETLTLLAQLGLENIGDLLKLPAADLTTRFGPLVLRRLEQTVGRVPEVVVPCVPCPELQTTYTFEYPTERFEPIMGALTFLADNLHAVLSRRNLGARHVECHLTHETAPPVTVEVGLYRPTNSPRYLVPLLRTRLEQVKLEEAVCAVRLSIPLAEQIPETQGELFGTGGFDSAGLGGLIDRLSSLLGEKAVGRALCVADAQPEYACKFEPALQTKKKAASEEVLSSAEAETLAPRPLCLWPEPIAVEVLAVIPDGPPRRFRWERTDYLVADWWGPERIETGWWRDDDVRRDYYVVTTDAGNRFWLFRRRDDGRWFLHGCFD
jgi:protein ImuB